MKRFFKLLFTSLLLSIVFISADTTTANAGVYDNAKCFIKPCFS